MEVSLAWDKAGHNGKSLQATLDSKIGGALKEAILLLFKDPVEGHYTRLKAAMDGFGCDSEVVARILGGLDKGEAKALAALTLRRLVQASS